VEFDTKRIYVQNKNSFGFCDVTMMLLRSQSISYFNLKRTIWLKGYQNVNYIDPSE